MREYMIKIGEHNGNILEVPDILVYGLAVLFIGTIFILADNNR